MKIALIADSHLSPLAPAFDANLAAARDLVAEHGHALTIHLGDISADGVNRTADIEHAARRLAGWPNPLHAVFGNHDVGDNPGGEGVAGAEAWRRMAGAFGDGRFRIDVAGWTLLGIDAQRFGRGDALEDEQERWLDAVLADARGPVGLFLHKPLFRDGPGDVAIHPRYVPPGARDRLLGRLAPVDLRFVVSGHAHQSRRLRVTGVEHLWMPSLAFVIPDAMQESIGRKEIGMATLTLDGDRHHLAFERPPGMAHHDLAAHAHVYPDQADRLRGLAHARQG